MQTGLMKHSRPDSLLVLIAKTDQYKIQHKPKMQIQWVDIESAKLVGIADSKEESGSGSSRLLWPVAAESDKGTGTSSSALCNRVYCTTLTYVLAYYTCALASPSRQIPKSSQTTLQLHLTQFLVRRTEVNLRWHDLSGFSQTKDERCVCSSCSSFFQFVDKTDS